jgi:undecaprenyl-diphosphatase
MSLISWLIEVDKSALLAINACHSPFLDNFFWLFTSIPIWIPFYLMIFYSIIKLQPQKWWITLLTLGLLIALTDQVSNNLIKMTVERLRPSHEPSLEGLVHFIAGYKGGRFGFVSSHAANSFGLALFAALLFRNKWLTISIFSWAILNSYSRIYLGVHYPGDIIGGAIVGLLIAWGLSIAYHKVMMRYTTNAMKSNSIRQHPEISKYTRIIVFTLILSTIILLITAKVFLKLTVI